MFFSLFLFQFFIIVILCHFRSKRSSCTNVLFVVSFSLLHHRHFRYFISKRSSCANVLFVVSFSLLHHRRRHHFTSMFLAQRTMH